MGEIQESFKDFSLVKKLDSILGTFRYTYNLTSTGPVNIVAFDIIVTASLKAQLRLERNTLVENHTKSLIVVDERSEETTLYSGTNHPPPTIS